MLQFVVNTVAVGELQVAMGQLLSMDCESYIQCIGKGEQGAGGNNMFCEGSVNYSSVCTGRDCLTSEHTVPEPEHKNIHER